MRFPLALFAFITFAELALGENKSIVAFAKAEARGATMITAEAPFAGDDNENGYTIFRISQSPAGPFADSQTGRTTGPAGWRGDVFLGLQPGTTYYIQVEFFDSDGIIANSTIGPGKNPQVLGPILTPTQSVRTTTVEAMVVEARDTEFLVSVPVRDDSDADGRVSISVAEALPGVPVSSLSWVSKCGPGFPLQPKACRVRSLEPGRAYYVRSVLTDSSGVIGQAQQVAGPLQYLGSKNLAFGKPVSTVPDTGWGCCPGHSEITDGRIQYDDWPHGFAWPGGGSCWAGGCPAGYNKSATIDLGSTQLFNRFLVWFHDPNSVPYKWRIEVSNDNAVFTEVYSTASSRCRTDQFPLNTSWSSPACAHTAVFPQLNARYVRYTFDDSTLFGGLHGWIMEMEVFAPSSAEVSPSQLAFSPQSVGTSSEKNVVVKNTGVVPLRVNGAVLDNTQSFQITNRCPGLLNAGYECPITVIFKPSSATPQSANLTVKLDYDVVIPLQGTGTPSTAPIISVSPLVLAFPDQSPCSMPGSTAGSCAGPAPTTSTNYYREVLIRNSGSGSASVNVSLTGSHFRIDNRCPVPPAELAPGLCTVFVFFQPSDASPEVKTGLLSVNFPTGQAVVQLSGLALADRDNDGIPDRWEIGPVTFEDGGTIDLSVMGADPDRPDIFVHVDAMEEIGHSHRPKVEAIQRIVGAFARRGINLHVDCGGDCPMKPGATWGSLSRAAIVPHIDPITSSTSEFGVIVNGEYSWESLDKFKSQYFPKARARMFHYALFVHNLRGASGLSSQTGLSRNSKIGDQSAASDFIVSLGSTANIVGTEMEVAGTFMHELGHNLGLTHGGCRDFGSGSIRCDATPYKPNYLSVMSYLFQSRGLLKDGKEGYFDYSDTELPPLIEASLDENLGIASAPQFGSRYFCSPLGERPVLDASRGIDWNCNRSNVDTNVAADIDGLAGIGTTPMYGGSDWGRLQYKGGSIGQAGVPPLPPTTQVAELSVAEDQQITTLRGVVVSSSGNTSVRPGATAAVSFSVTNSGNSPDVFTLSRVVDGPPGSESLVALGSIPGQVTLAAKSGITYPVNVQATSPLQALGQFTIRLRATSSANSSAADTASVRVSLGSADLSILPGSATAGILFMSRWNRAISVRNLSSDPAFDTQISISLPAGLSGVSVNSSSGNCIAGQKVICNLGRLDGGASANVALYATAMLPGLGSLSVDVQSSTADPVEANNHYTETLNIVGKPSIAITASVVEKTNGGAKIRLACTNTGNGPASVVTLTSLLPRVQAGSGSISLVTPALPMLIGSLQPGQTQSIELRLSMPSTITRIQLVETGTVRDELGSQYTFSLAQVLTP